MNELPILQKTYDLINWYVPILNRLPRNHKYALGDRLTNNLYDLLDGLIRAKYQKDKREILTELNTHLEIMRYQTRLLHDFQLMHLPRYEHASKLINEIGTDLGAWLKQQKAKSFV